MHAGLVRIANPSGLAFLLDANGRVRRIDRGDVMLNTFVSNELESVTVRSCPATVRLALGNI